MTMNERIEPGSGQQVRQRRILFAVLSPYMKRDALYHALWEWEDAHAARPGASLHKFVTSVCATSGLAERRLEINRALVETMQMKDAALGPDPMHEMIAYRRRTGAVTDGAGHDVTAPSGRPHTIVFEAILRGFCTALERYNPSAYPACLRYVTDNMSLLRLVPPAEVGLASFLRKMTERLTESYTPEAMQSLLHLLYVAACEYYGPVKSDELLEAAVAEAERLPEARMFPPRHLL